MVMDTWFKAGFYSILILACAMVALPAGAANAQSSNLPPDGGNRPAREFDLRRTFALGRAMFEQNGRVHAALYMMQKLVSGSARQDAVPLITTADGEDRVRFAHATPAGPEVFFQVEFRSHAAPVAFAPSDHALTADETVQFNARALVLAAIANRCIQDYDVIVLKNPDGDGWLVWALGTSPDDGTLVMGVHYRFLVSADGTTDLHHEVMAPVCGTYNVEQTPHLRLANITTVETIASQPTEIHVVQSLTRNVPIYVATAVNRKLWVVQPYGIIAFVRDLN
jgi:hypothetical protein